QLCEPASIDDIQLLERALAVDLPSELRELLRETNGVSAVYGTGLVWPVDRIKHDNQYFRAEADFKELYMPFDHLLFFGDHGNGDQFAYAVLDGAVRWLNIFAWNHEDDSRTWVAPSLQRYLEWWSQGKIKL